MNDISGVLNSERRCDYRFAVVKRRFYTVARRLQGVVTGLFKYSAAHSAARPEPTVSGIYNGIDIFVGA